MNWQEMIKTLISEGWTQSGIAQEVGIGQSTVAEILAGRSRDMRWTNGDRLLRLYRRVTKTRAKPRDPTTTEAEHA